MSLFYSDKSRRDGKSNTCKSCDNCRKREWQKENRERVNSSNRNYALRNPEKIKAMQDAYIAANPEKVRERHIAYRENNRDAIRERNRLWGKENQEYKNAVTAKYRAMKKSASVDWSDNSIISDFYWWASEISRVCGEKHHVDHIVPLVHSDVCGLHCEDNLQILSAYENQSKSNHWWPGMNGFAEYILAPPPQHK